MKFSHEYTALLFKKSTILPLLTILGINLTGFISNAYMIEKFIFTTFTGCLTLYKLYKEIQNTKKDENN